MFIGGDVRANDDHVAGNPKIVSPPAFGLAFVLDDGRILYVRPPGYEDGPACEAWRASRA